MSMLSALIAEPPFRLIMKAAVRILPVSIETKDRWGAADRPHYLAGVLYAARQARREGIDAISVVEFGVADGYGLRVLEAHSAAVSALTGVRIHVYGFDSGRGMPEGTGDYRDHPDVWQAGDYQMDVAALRRTLKFETRLVLGPIRDTVAAGHLNEPVGFMSIDVDYYSSAVDALDLLLCTPSLHRVTLYFDDISAHYNHPWAGELLAIEEFNEKSRHVKISPWRGLRAGRAYPEAPWLDAMFIAHDLDQISRTRLTRGAARMR